MKKYFNVNKAFDVYNANLSIHKFNNQVEKLWKENVSKRKKKYMENNTEYQKRKIDYKI